MRRWQLAVLGAANAALAILLALAVNSATPNLPRIFTDHPGLTWALVAFFGACSLVCSALLALGSNRNGRNEVRPNQRDGISRVVQGKMEHHGQGDQYQIAGDADFTPERRNNRPGMSGE
jgi:hypothetical protein